MHFGGAPGALRGRGRPRAPEKMHFNVDSHTREKLHFNGVDIHPKEKIPGVELILTRLHAGAKFSNKNYRFSGGLHGVGVSVVNALSKKLEVLIRRDGKEYKMAFANGKRTSKLGVVGEVGKTNTGTTIRFWQDG